MNPQDWTLIGLALAAVALLVLLVTRLKVNGFIALVLASLLVGGGAVWLGQPVKVAGGKLEPYTMQAVAKSIQDGVGATLGGIAAVLGLGAMLGKLLADSGGAEILAKRFALWFGRDRIQWCIMLLALVVGLTTWFAVGLVLLLPILLMLTRETGQPFLRLTLPLLSCLSVMHGVMPPHPGPVVAVDALHANTGLVLFWGFIVGLPTAAMAGPLFAKWAVKHVQANPPDLGVRADSLATGVKMPGFGLTLFSILLPVGLMLLSTVAELTLPKGDAAREAITFIGNPTMALLISVCFSLWSLGSNCGYSLPHLLKSTESSVAMVGMTILVVGAGGGVCASIAGRWCGGRDWALWRSNAFVAAALRLADLSIYPCSHGVGHCGDHDRLRAIGPCDCTAPGTDPDARCAYHCCRGLRVAVSFTPQ